MNPSISLKFYYLESDYVSALRAHYSTRLHLRLDIGIALILFSIGVFLLSSPNNHMLGVFCLVAATVFALLLFFAFFYLPKIAFRRELKFRDEYSLTFSPESIYFSTTSIDSVLQWGMYTSALINEKSYLLYYGDSQFTVVPKRVFKDAEQLNEFEELINMNISKIVYKK